MDHLLKTKKEYKNLKKQEIQDIFIKTNGQSMLSAQHGLWRFYRFTTRTASDKVLCDKVFNIAIDPKCDGYQRGLASMVYKFFDKKSSGANTNTSGDTVTHA